MFFRLTLALTFLIATPLWSGPVRLTNDTGDLTVEGELLSRDGELFRIETAFGPVTIDAGMMTCSGTGCPDPAELIVTASVGGSNALIHRLFPALLEAFADRRKLQLSRVYIDDQTETWQLKTEDADRLVAVFDVTEMDQGDVVERVQSGDTMLGFAVTDPETELPGDIIALDALVPAVAPDNPRAMVTLAQLQALLTGETESWARLGGSDAPASVHVLNGAADAARWFGVAGLPQNVVRHASEKDLADAVAQDASALGFLPFSSLGNAVPLIVSGACGLATPATRDTIRAEDYPITLPVYLLRSGASQPKLVREFIAFARSPAAQSLIFAAGFVDQAIGRISFERQGGRIANAVLTAGQDAERIADVQDMIGTLLDGARLTMTFRFRDGSSDLDPQSVSNVQRLADAISDGEFDGSQMLFVGFSDVNGDTGANLRLSERRARAVRRAVSARVSGSTVGLRVAAFGELMPMACNDTPWGDRVNRRVEVWVSPSEVTR